MEENGQKINCTVESCKYNNGEENLCMLQAIHVSPIQGNDSKEPDESMCASYKYED